MTMTLMILALLADPPKCECGGTWKIENENLTLMWKDKAISVSPIVACQAQVLGKTVDLTKGGTIACPCGKSVKYAAQMELKHWTGTSACDGVCGASWTVTDDTISWEGGKFAGAAFAKEYKIKNHKASVGSAIDLLKDKSFNCL